LSALVIGFTVYGVLRFASQKTKSEGFIVNSLHIASAIVAFLVAALSIEVVSAVVVAKQFDILIFSGVFGGLMLDIESRVKNKRMARLVGISTSLVLALVVLVQQQLHDGIVVLAVGLLLTILLVGIGIVQKHKEKMLIGGVALVSVIALNAGGLIDFFVHAGWLGFASLGIIAILIASLLERFGAMFSMQARKWLV